jgi:hypothetical protein
MNQIWAKMAFGDENQQKQNYTFSLKLTEISSSIKYAYFKFSQKSYISSNFSLYEKIS